MSGASGQAIALRLIEELIKGAEVHLVVSTYAVSILRLEAGVDWSGDTPEETEAKVRAHFSKDGIFLYGENEMAAPLSSGSFRTDGMFVVPCSMKTLSGIANGYAGTLIERAADVTIKEGRPLLIAPREMPLSAVHLENMLKLAKLGVKIAPPVAGFYHGPLGISDMVDFFAGKMLDAMGVENGLYRRWNGP